MAQDELGLPHGTIRATVLIETILAAFEMDEILYELRDHIAGLNCGRWDYIFSFIKKFRNRPDFVLPDRALVTMTTHFLRSYSLLAIKTCHRRGASPWAAWRRRSRSRTIRRPTRQALQKVREDKEREAGDGHDGTWVAHPGLVPMAHGSLRREDAAAQPDRPAPRRRAGHRPATCCRAHRADHREGTAHQRQRRHAVPRSRGCGASAACRSST